MISLSDTPNIDFNNEMTSDLNNEIITDLKRDIKTDKSFSFEDSSLFLHAHGLSGIHLLF